MNFYVNYFDNSDIEITKRGNFKIGRITAKKRCCYGFAKRSNTFTLTCLERIKGRNLLHIVRK
jgi:hypothetical protein